MLKNNFSNCVIILLDQHNNNIFITQKYRVKDIVLDR